MKRTRTQSDESCDHDIPSHPWRSGSRRPATERKMRPGR
ncbi:hypothetical protein D187_000797 [Cystobacter fuscus DSM 2262]|uniref:Uncharacterized protein n=1 Tax=Cystobacter fuscus (strain ATCC 25194 / DSM 2262 / NBRC 100088 / M29) TaxID=1242864 RepID=S9PQQ5_CYSF2|nr:hypothetical protein D187_000797 [Cystobacter fuscus DSM 2262]